MRKGSDANVFKTGFHHFPNHHSFFILIYYVCVSLGGIVSILYTISWSLPDIAHFGEEGVLFWLGQASIKNSLTNICGDVLSKAVIIVLVD